MNSLKEAISVVHAPDRLFRHRRDLRRRQEVAHRVDDRGTVGVGRLLRVDLERVQARDGRHRRDRVADADPEDLPDVRGGVGARQQDPLAVPYETYRGRARQRGLADAALPGEEEEPRQVVEEGQSEHQQQQPFGASAAGAAATAARSEGQQRAGSWTWTSAMAGPCLR